MNVVGGLKLNSKDSSSSYSDLGVSVALVSSLTGIPVRADTAFVGEIGLSGELRSVDDVDRMIIEAERMGFTRVVVPARHQKWGKQTYYGNRKVEVLECWNVLDAVNKGLTEDVAKKKVALKGSRSSSRSYSRFGSGSRYRSDKAGKMRKGTGYKFPRGVKELGIDDGTEDRDDDDNRNHVYDDDDDDDDEEYAGDGQDEDIY